MRKISLIVLILITQFSCKTKSATILNRDDNAQMPKVKNDIFIILEKSNDPNYGYSDHYPINLGFTSVVKHNKANRFLDALAGPKGEIIHYKFIESCCPFLTKTGGMGTGLLDKYEITWDGNKKPVYLYINSYSKGKILIPKGLQNKKQ